MYNRFDAFKWDIISWSSVPSMKKKKHLMSLFSFHIKGTNNGINLLISYRISFYLHSIIRFTKVYYSNIATVYLGDSMRSQVNINKVDGEEYNLLSMERVTDISVRK